MRELIVAGLCALALTGCVSSRPTPPPSVISLPPPPPVADRPCYRTPIRTDSAGALSSALAEEALRTRDLDLAMCEAKRLVLIDAWPKNGGIESRTTGERDGEPSGAPAGAATGSY